MLFPMFRALHFFGCVKINCTLFFASYNIVFTVQPLLCVTAHKNNDLIFVRNSKVRCSIKFFSLHVVIFFKMPNEENIFEALQSL